MNKSYHIICSHDHLPLMTSALDGLGQVISAYCKVISDLTDSKELELADALQLMSNAATILFQKVAENQDELLDLLMGYKAQVEQHIEDIIKSAKLRPSGSAN